MKLTKFGSFRGGVQLCVILCLATAAASAKDLTWTGGNWNMTDQNWTDADGHAAAFAAGDNVTFAKGGSVTLAVNVSPGDVLFDIPAGETLTLTFNRSCSILGTATSFRKTGGGTLSLADASPTDGSKRTGIAVTCGVVVEEGAVALATANAIYTYNLNAANWWTVKNGARLNILNRNATGNVSQPLSLPQLFNLHVENGGTLSLSCVGSHCGNAFRNLTLEGGAILDTSAGGASDAGGNYGIIHIGDTLCVTGDTAVTIAPNTSFSKQWLGIDWGAKPTTFDVADVTGDDDPDLILNMSFAHGPASAAVGLVKTGKGRLKLGVESPVGYAPSGDITIQDGVLEYCVQNQLNGVYDRTVTVSTNATLHYALRNIQNGNKFDDTGFNLKIVVDHGTFLIHDPGNVNGHNFLGKELTLIDGVLTNAMNGFHTGSGALALMTIGKRLTLKGTQPYDLKTYGKSNQSVHLWGVDTTEFVVDDITGTDAETGAVTPDDATDATIHWTLIDRYNTNPDNERQERSGFIKRGAGTLCLTSKANKFTGDVDVKEGTLRLDWPTETSDFGNNETTILGDMTDATRTVTVWTNATLDLVRRNTFTSGKYAAQMNNRLATPIVLKGGTLSIGDANAFGDLTVENGAFAYTTGGGWGVMGVRGTFKVTGDTPCTLPDVTTNPFFFLYPDKATVFDVADVTGDVAADLTVGLRIVMPPDQLFLDYFRTNANQSVYGFVKTGAGTLALTADHGTTKWAFNGDATVNEGTLRVDGTIAKSDTVRVAAGAFLSGAGTVNNAVLAAGGGFRQTAGATTPLTVAGDLTIGANPVFRLDNPDGLPVKTIKAAMFKVNGAVTGADNLSGAAVYLDGELQTPSAWVVHYSSSTGRCTVGANIGTVVILK